jgi:hypothetical protein
LPPSGITPGRPEFPDGAIPPLAYLPPPPIGTLPPDVLAPGRPGALSPGEPPSVGAPPSSGEIAGNAMLDRQVLAPLLAPHAWNLWSDETYYGYSDSRVASDITGNTNILLSGADRTLESGWIVGLSAGWQKSRTQLFSGGMNLSSNGWSIGPYAAYPISDRWLIDGAFTYTQLDNRQDLLALSGNYVSRSYSGTLGATGQYLWDNIGIRPRVALSYGQYEAVPFALAGTLQDLSLSLNRPSTGYNYGTLMMSSEFNRVFILGGGLPVMPYVNLELDYAFARPNNGEILSSDLTMIGTTPVSGAVRAGVRALLSSSVTPTAGGGYTSIGEPGYQAWELHLNLALAL